MSLEKSRILFNIFESFHPVVQPLGGWLVLKEHWLNNLKRDIVTIEYIQSIYNFLFSTKLACVKFRPANLHSWHRTRIRKTFSWYLGQYHLSYEICSNYILWRRNILPDGHHLWLTNALHRYISKYRKYCDCDTDSEATSEADLAELHITH